jgi:hypothetical protein
VELRISIGFGAVALASGSVEREFVSVILPPITPIDIAFAIAFDKLHLLTEKIGPPHINEARSSSTGGVVGG